MKRLGCLFSLSLFTIFISLSAPDSVASDLVSRPVGLLRIDLAPGEQRLTSTPFECLVEPGCPHPALNMPQDISILIWDTATATYTTLTTDVCGLTPGSAFWLCNEGATTQTVYLSGSVILDETRSLTLPPSLSLMGYPFSTAIVFTNTELGRLFASDTLIGDTLSGFPSSGVPSSVSFEPGRGYWYNRASAETIEITEPRPYADVFPPAGGELAITSIVATANGVSLGLAIPVDCIAVDIFSKALTNGPATLDTGWTLCDTLAPPALSEVEGPPLWTDPCPLTTDPCTVIPDLFSSPRLYLLARADIDLDQNDIPDARERFVLGDSPSTISATEEEPTLDSVGTPSAAASVGQGARSGAIYVDAQKGDDTCDGFARAKAPGGKNGPKRTIHAGAAALSPGEFLVVREGVYAEGRIVFPSGVRVVCEGRVVLNGHL